MGRVADAVAAEATRRVGVGGEGVALLPSHAEKVPDTAAPVAATAVPTPPARVGGRGPVVAPADGAPD